MKHGQFWLAILMIAGIVSIRGPAEARRAQTAEEMAACQRDYCFGLKGDDLADCIARFDKAEVPCVIREVEAPTVYAEPAPPPVVAPAPSVIVSQPLDYERSCCLDTPAWVVLDNDMPAPAVLVGPAPNIGSKPKPGNHPKW